MELQMERCTNGKANEQTDKLTYAKCTDKHVDGQTDRQTELS